MMHSIIPLLLVMFFLTFYVQAQEAVDDSATELTDDFFAEQDSSQGTMDIPSVPIGVSLENMDEETHGLYIEALREHYIYRKSGYEHRRKVFDWQLFSGKVTFYLVIMLVTSGIYFAGVQFHIAMKQLAQGVGGEPKSTEFKASSTGIEVSSPVLGVIILSISLAFFYLYLVYVYPIEEIF
jgi:uncharacterized BrkB/YihY/UPF0761 family membrane protein